MRLTGAQVREIAEISDGADITLQKQKGDSLVWVHRLEDDLRLPIGADGKVVPISADDQRM